MNAVDKSLMISKLCVGSKTDLLPSATTCDARMLRSKRVLLPRDGGQNNHRPSHKDVTRAVFHWLLRRFAGRGGRLGPGAPHLRRRPAAGAPMGPTFAGLLASGAPPARAAAPRPPNLLRSRGASRGRRRGGDAGVGATLVEDQTTTAPECSGAAVQSRVVGRG